MIGTIIILFLDIAMGILFSVTGVIALAQETNDEKEMFAGIFALCIGIVFLMSSAVINQSI